jgi:hypothetical protein
MSWIDLIGYAACVSVFATFCMSEMVPLRIVAIFSNVLFAAFGALAHIHPVLVLHIVLLPVNLVRLIRAVAPDDEGFGTAITPFIIGSRATKLRAVWRRRRREES